MVRLQRHVSILILTTFLLSIALIASLSSYSDVKICNQTPHNIPNNTDSFLIIDNGRMERNISLKGDDLMPKKIIQRGKLFVLMVTGFRTGSTFLGEMFNQNSDVFYMFEPLHHKYLNRQIDKMEGVTNQSSMAELKTSFLKGLFYNCTAYAVDFRKTMKHLRCGTQEENLIRFNTTECPPLDQDIMTNSCLSKKIVAPKVIRIFSLTELEQITEIEDVNLKIIHLVRDPRATVRSRTHFGTLIYLDNQIRIPTLPLTVEKIETVT